MEYVIVNGEIQKKEEADLSPFLWNLPHLLHQKIWYGFGGIPLFSENLTNIKQHLLVFGAKIPELFYNERELFRITKRLLNKNKYFRSGYINLQLFIQEQKTNFIITASAFSEFDFPFPEQGLLLQFSEQRKYSGNLLSQIFSSHQSIWKAETTILENNPLWNSIFLNDQDAVCDVISANIFMLKNKTLFTPSLKTGCSNNILRNIILKISERLHFEIQESENILKEDCFQMNEVFIASEQTGFQWILGIENKRFVRQNSLVIHQKLNEFLRNKVI